MPQHSAPSNLFFSDRRGDRDIVRYGSINRHDIPDYRRAGYGFVVGLPLDMKIDRDRSTDKTIVLVPATKHRGERLLAKKHACREYSRALRLVRPSDDKDADALNHNFVALSGAPKSKRNRDEFEDESDDTSFDHRGVRDARPERHADPDAEYESDTLENPVIREVTARNSALVRRTKDHPEDLEAWLDLIEHQETMMKAERLITELRDADRQHLADIRISIYEQALRRGSDDQSSQIKLYCNMMAEARKTWNETQMVSNWTEILNKFPTNKDLWVEYLAFVQGAFTTFKYETCKITFQRCLKALQSDSTNIGVDVCLFVLSRLISMIRQAGYQELALAIWQALLEYYVLGPVETYRATREALSSFEAFWESEVPRIGEDQARGWRCPDVEYVPFAEPNKIALMEPNPADTALDDFRRREIDRMSKLDTPGRTSDEVGEDDPFHMILFEDVEIFLKLIPSSCDKTILLSTFLQSCNLPPLMQIGSDVDTYNLDPFLKTEPSVGSKKISSGFTEHIAKYANCPMKRFQPTVQLLFDGSFPDVPEFTSARFVRNVLKLSIGEVSDVEAVGEYLLAFESNYFPSEASKTAKKLLKTRPASMRLYNAYGLAELHHNNPVKASQVFGAALTMQKNDTPFSAPGSLSLFYSWIWGALREHNTREALWRFVSLNGKLARPSTDFDETPDQAALLRVQRALSDTSERALLGGDLSLAAMATSLLAMMTYLLDDERPEPALEAFRKLSIWFADHKGLQCPAAELHAQYIADFMTYHTQHAPIVKPALLRKVLDPLIATFPDNTILLSVYAANEARFAINDRVRSIMHRKANEARTIVSWSFSIHHEILRGEVAGSTSHSIRALFTRAESSVGAHCPALWKQHLLFEVAEARKKRRNKYQKRPRKDGKKSREEEKEEQTTARVKDLFFRGLTHLPWCKTYMMMAFTHLGEEFLSQEDLRKVYNVMVEKELRLYIELEESNA